MATKTPRINHTYLVDLDHETFADFVYIDSQAGSSSTGGKVAMNPKHADINPYTFEIEENPRLIRYRTYPDGRR